MAKTKIGERFFGSTRGRLVRLLRGAARTVEELAAALALTDNAVRAHLATLERDGLVQQAGVRRGGAQAARHLRAHARSGRPLSESL
jgi:predicted ArsR family transcriptional regulator